jgi:hypothetical protein
MSMTETGPPLSAVMVTVTVLAPDAEAAPTVVFPTARSARLATPMSTSTPGCRDVQVLA